MVEGGRGVESREPEALVAERRISDRQGARQALILWLVATVGIVAAQAAGLVVPWIGQNAKAVAVLLFLYLPAWAAKRAGEPLESYGLPRWPWHPIRASRELGRDLAWGLGVCALMTLPVVGGFWLLLQVLPLLPESWLGTWIPYRSGGAGLAFRLPDAFGLHVLDQLLAVSLPEELFFRGFLQTRLQRHWGHGRLRILGVRIGAAFLLTQVLFSLSHLGDPSPWRLWVFFPALLFGWLRERTGSLGAPILVHAYSNLLLMTLEASAFG